MHFVTIHRINFLVVFVVFAHSSAAQFNDTTNYFVHVGSTGIINKTNDTKSYVLNNNVRFSLYKKSYSVNAATAWIYGENQDRLTNNDVNAMVDFNLHKTFEHFYYWGIATYEKSVSLQLNHRFQGGLGIGYHILDKEKAVVVISDGILYESTGLFDTPEPGLDSVYSTYRNSFRIKFRMVLNDIVTFDGYDFVQHSLSDRRDYIIKSQTNLSIKLIKWLSFTTSLTYNKLSITGRENLLFTFGLNAEKYF